MSTKVIQCAGWVAAGLVTGWVIFIVFWSVPGSTSAVTPSGASGMANALAPSVSVAPTLQPGAPAGGSAPADGPAAPGESAPASPDEKNDRTASPGSGPADESRSKPGNAPRRPNYVEKWDFDLEKKPIPTNVQ